jgi:hypothetical protein
LYQYALTNKIRDPKLVKRLLSYSRLRRKSDSMKLERCEKMFDLNDPDTVKLLSDKHNEKLLKFLPESMQANREVVLTFVKDAPYTIRYAHVKFFDDKEIMMIVIDKYWGMIDAVSERLMDDEEVLLRTMASERRRWEEECAELESMDIFYTKEELPEEEVTYHCIKYASKRLQKKYDKCIYRVGCGRYEFPFPLRLNTWFYDEELTDKKYVEKRNDRDDYWKLIEEEQTAYELQRELEKQRDITYRKNHGMNTWESVYRDEDGHVITAQLYNMIHNI